ncbi:uncharacterized protein TNCV_3436101 [Trichonephila clavipes]|nr:uncharacterized protein TNCV_3436101 [Trichonephila clavipes]
MANAICVCYICHASVPLPKKENVERHFKTTHESFDTHFPLKSELRKQKLKTFKTQLIRQPSSFVKSNTLSKAANVVTLHVSHLLAKHKKPFADGEIIEKAFLEASDSLFDSFKNKPEIISAIKDIQLSRRTLTRRIEIMNSDLADQLTEDITN